MTRTFPSVTNISNENSILCKEFIPLRRLEIGAVKTLLTMSREKEISYDEKLQEFIKWSATQF
jgi:hypothetical protein